MVMPFIDLLNYQNKMKKTQANPIGNLCFFIQDLQTKTITVLGSNILPLV